MTQLHYRVWDGEQMHYWDDEGISLTIEGSNWFLHHERIGYIASSEEVGAALMWGTGLKDKNSRLMYERDSIRDNDGFLWKVYWEDGSFWAKGGEFNSREQLIEFAPDFCEVYQNPDLLEAAE